MNNAYYLFAKCKHLLSCNYMKKIGSITIKNDKILMAENSSSWNQ